MGMGFPPFPETRHDKATLQVEEVILVEAVLRGLVWVETFERVFRTGGVLGGAEMLKLVRCQVESRNGTRSGGGDVEEVAVRRLRAIRPSQSCSTGLQVHLTPIRASF